MSRKKYKFYLTTPSTHFIYSYMASYNISNANVSDDRNGVKEFKNSPQCNRLVHTSAGYSTGYT